MKIGFLSHLDLNLYAFRLPVMLELKKLGHTPIAIAPSGDYLKKINDLGIQTASYNISRKSLNPFKELHAIYEIYKAIKPLNLDILHTFTAKPNIYGTIAGKAAKVPKVYNLVEGLGSFYLEEDLKSKTVRSVIETLYKAIFYISDGVMFVNSSDPEYFINKQIIAEEKIHKIDGVGIDTNEWIPLEQKLNNDKIIITMVARAIRHKGAVEFIEAARILKSKYQNLDFIYIGAPDIGNPSSLSEDILKNEPAITYLGERSDVKERLIVSDIFVLPSYREGLPRTVLEAMSLGLPIVTTDAPGCKDAVSDNGFLVPVKDAPSLANAIEKLILDKNLRIAMGQKSREIAVARFDVKPIIKEHLRLYGITF